MSNINDYEMKMLEAFVGKEDKVPFYANAYNTMVQNGSIQFKWFWTWWGFFGNWGFFLYRKAYIPAGIIFVAMLLFNSIPLLVLITAIAVGGTSPYFIMKMFVDKKTQIENTVKEEAQRIQAMSNIGGVNKWVIVLYAIQILLLTAGMYAYVMMISQGIR